MSASGVDTRWVSSTQRDFDKLDLPKSMKIRCANGAFLMVPRTAAHFDNGHTLVTWARSVPGVRGVGEFKLVPAVDGYEPEPDFALIEEGAHDPRRTSYAADEVLFVAEIVYGERAVRLRSQAQSLRQSRCPRLTGD